MSGWDHLKGKTITIDPASPPMRTKTRVVAAPAKPKRSPRKPSLASVAKQVSKAGIEVAKYEVKRDGTIVVVAGRPDSNVEEVNEWDAEYGPH
jgi:hypothetical protein